MKTLQNTRSAGHSNHTETQAKGSAARKRNNTIILNQQKGYKCNFTWKYHMLLKEHKQRHKQPDLMCYIGNYTNKNLEFLHKHKEIHCHIYMFKCQLNNNTRKEVKEHKNICVQMPVFKCYICQNCNWL